MPLSVVGIAMLGLHGVSLVAGLFGNMFILSVNVIGWIKSSSDLGSCDLILSSLALSNLGHLCVYFAIQTNPAISYAFFSLDRCLKCIFITLFCLRCSSLWFANWFCVYCCVKIVRFTHPLLVRLVLKFLQNVHWILLASILLSIIVCIPEFFGIQHSAKCPSDRPVFEPANVSVNGSIVDFESWKIFDKKYVGFVINISVTFAIFIFSSAAILTTLCRHMRHMEQNEVGFSMDAHLGAVKTVASLLVLYSATSLTQCLRFLKVSSHESPEYVVGITVMACFPAINSIILILGISRQRKALARMLSLLVCCGRAGS